jgi:type IV pilus assembly protein PilC
MTESLPWDAPRVRPYAWVGRDAEGQAVRGERLAAGVASLRWALQAGGVHLEHAQPVRRVGLWTRGAVHARDQVIFMRQLATLLRAGVPVLQALEIAEVSQAEPVLRTVIGNVRQRLAAGQTLSDAMQAHPRHFETLTTRMIAAGELSGALDTMCDRAASYQERMLKLRDTVRTAMFYPAMVLSLAMLLTLALLVFVIPSFAQLYADAGALLPWPTRWVMAVSTALMEYGLWLVVLALGVGVVLRRMWGRWPRVRGWMDALLFRLPILGAVMAKAALARWAGTFSALFAAGIPLHQTLSAASGAAGHLRYSEVLGALQADISAGKTVSASLLRARVFPPMMAQMAAVGEESGSLDSLMAKVAEYYEHEVAEAVARMSSLIEPLMMVVLGLIIGGVVIAMYLPVFQMGSVL